MDLGTSIRMAVDTGKIVFGSDRTKKLALSGKPKLVVIAANCPAETRQDLEHYCKLSKVQLHTYPGTGVDLGTTCGKPFVISAFAVLDFGNSDLGELVKTK